LRDGKIGDSCFGIRSRPYAEDENSVIGSSFRHSAYYHSFFEGYTEKKIAKEDGCMYIERLYTSPWIVRQTSKKHTVLLLVRYWGLYATAVILFGSCMSLNTGSNLCPYVALPGLLTVIPLFLLLFKLISYSSATGRMTKYEYKNSSFGIRRLSVLGCAGVSLTAVAVGVYCVLDSSESADCLTAIMLLFAAVCLMCIYLTERRVLYKMVKNDSEISEEGYTIQ